MFHTRAPKLRAQHDLRGNIQRTHDDRALVQPLFLLWQSAARGNTPRKSTRGHCHFSDSRNGQIRLLHLQRVPLPQLHDHVLLHLQLGRFFHKIRAKFSHHGRCQFLNRLIALDVSAVFVSTNFSLSLSLFYFYSTISTLIFQFLPCKSTCSYEQRRLYSSTCFSNVLCKIARSIIITILRLLIDLAEFYLFVNVQ
ncbi:hypothetical protein T09_14370 [Trichinella sp. T9]|nr:hypothetical protein T09_14370 [Trichinella sp. T9]